MVDRTSSSLTVAWDAPARATFYELHRSSSERGDYSVVASDIASGKFVDQNLEPEGVYYYVVRACNKLGCSDASDEIAAGITESATAVNAPETPPFIDAMRKGLIWTGVKGATYYEVYGDGNLLATVSAPKTRSAHGAGQWDSGRLDLLGPFLFFPGAAAVTRLGPAIRQGVLLGPGSLTVAHLILHYLR